MSACSSAWVRIVFLNVGILGVAGAFGAVACSSSGASPEPLVVEDAGELVDARKVAPALDVEVPETRGPTLLSETGLYADFAARTLSSDVLPYAVRYPLWTDSAEKKRYLQLPASSKIDTTDMDAWIFPAGTKIWKEFWVGGKLLETRLLWKISESDGWWMIAYVWRADGSDAEATVTAQNNVAGTTHDVPSQANCLECHGGRPDRVLGLAAIQLSNGGAGFLSDLIARGALTVAPAGELEVPGNDEERAALGYLHGNCSYCHNEQSPLKSQSKMQLLVSTKDKAPTDTGVYRTAFGLEARHVMPGAVGTVIVKGDPDKSQLALRMGLRDSWSMPPLGTKESDDAGLAAVRTWITNLK